MPHITVRNLDVFYRDEGEGPPVLLGHSSTGSSGQWRNLIERMADRYRLLAPDHLGYGRTSSHRGAVSLVEDELAIIAALVDLADEPVHLVGHSYGGSLLARTAVRLPGKVRSLTLIEPTLFYLLQAFGREAEHQEIKAVADRVVHYVDAGDPAEASRGFIGYWVGDGAFEQMDERTQEGIVRGMAKLRSEWPEAFEPHDAKADALAALQVSVQLICATDTTSAARSVIDILRAIWPQALYREIAGAGHMSPVTHPDAVNLAIATFIDDVDQGTAHDRRNEVRRTRRP
jgi:pimeloyl-ACP methyl ester carboxylesterase